MPGYRLPSVRVCRVFVMLPGLMLLGVSPAVADTASSSIEQQYFPSIPIVLSATRLPQPVEDSPIAVTVITRAMIKASGATEIPDLFRLVPGFLVDYDNGHTAAVSYHMLPDRYVRQQQVLIDGRSVYDPLLGGVPWMELPITIDDIQRIEVIRGPDAATYGSNSFLGVINIITRSAILDKGTTVKTNIGSDGLRENFVRHGGSNGALDYRLNMAYRSDNGFDGRHDGKTVRLLNSRFDYQLDNRNNLMLQAGYSGGPRQMDDTFDNSIPLHDSQTFSQYQQFKWQQTNAPEDEYSFQIYHNALRINDSYTRLDNQLYWNGDTISDRYDIEAQKIKRVNKAFRYVVGASYRLDQVISQLYFGTGDPLKNRIRRVFAHGEYRLNKKVLFNLGLMYENNDITNTDLSPQASVNYKFTPHDTFRVSASKAYRTPVIFEQYPNMAISAKGAFDQLVYNGSQVNNEQIKEYDIGFVGSHDQGRFNYNVKFYYQDVMGLINLYNNKNYSSINSADADGQALYFNNFDNAIIRGAETGFDWRFATGTKLHVAYAYIDITSTDKREDYSKAAPKSVLNILATQQFSHGYESSLNLFYRSSMKPLARRAYDPPYMNPYTRVDLRVAKNFRVGDTAQSIALVVRNIFNAVQETRLLNNVDRGAYVTYQIKFD